MELSFRSQFQVTFVLRFLPRPICMKLGYDITVASEKVKGLEELYD